MCFFTVGCIRDADGGMGLLGMGLLINRFTTMGFLFLSLSLCTFGSLVS